MAKRLRARLAPFRHSQQDNDARTLVLMGAWKGIHHGILLSSSEELPMAQEKIESLPALDHGALNVIVETWKGQRSKFEFDFKRGNNCRDENGNDRWVHDATCFLLLVANRLAGHP